MTGHASKKGRVTDQERSPDDPTERRFNETVRNLLNTPHKPHKGKGDSKPERKERRAKRPTQDKASQADDSR